MLLIHADPFSVHFEQDLQDEEAERFCLRRWKISTHWLVIKFNDNPGIDSEVQSLSYSNSSLLYDLSFL